MTDTPAPPSHLQAAGRRFYETMVDTFDFDVQELQLLQLLCEQIDLQARARKEIRKHGLTLTNPKSGAIKPNPALSIERQATRLIASLVRQLALPDDEPQVQRGLRRGARPIRGHGRVATARRAD